MIKSVRFENFKALRDATLPLGRFTLIVGPNGSGKSTALQALRAAGSRDLVRYESILTVGLEPGSVPVRLMLAWGGSQEGVTTEVIWNERRASDRAHFFPDGSVIEVRTGAFDPFQLDQYLCHVRIYALDANYISTPVQLTPRPELEQNGHGLAGVLDSLRDTEPERFEALNEEWGRWLPEFDRILFNTPANGNRIISLRTRRDHHKLDVSSISQGTLIALAILTLAYLPDPPKVVCFEEPDRAIHPRLLRHVQDALYRLAYPEGYGEKREPVQVIATTHSPYFLDLYKDHPEEIVIAEKVGLEAKFERLTDRPDIDKILDGAPLGEVWYSGVLGGVPAGV
jgi:predicted ATPase